MKDDENFNDFWREMNDKASFKDFYSPEKTPENETDRYKIERAGRQLCEIIKEIQNILEGLK